MLTMKISKAQRYTITISIVGLLLAALTFFVQRKLLKTSSENLPLVTLPQHVKGQVIQSHLWFEELIAGDNTLNFEKNVIAPLVASRDILQNAYDGKQTSLGKFEKGTVELRALLKETVIDIDRLADAGKQLWAAKSAGDSVEIKEKEFDVTYKSVMARVDYLNDVLTEEVQGRTTAMEIESWVTLTLFGLGFLVVGYFTYSIQRRNDLKARQNETHLAEESGRVRTLSTFIEAVSAGNYDIELEKSSQEDNLIGTLISMRDKLKQNAEEDRRRNWTTTGLAQIGEILRSTTSSTSELYDNIIRFIVKYTKSNQGGLFILNNNDERNPFLELVGCYAFERKKFLTKQVPVGNGIVGQCFLEGKTIYLLQVPQDYVNITSGLGGTNPNALLVVPLKINDTIYGVLELASFTKYDNFEIELVEKLAETIASTISSVKVNETTRVLLERTQEQAEQMKSQEEEIRQNMEELEATQEEMRRKQTILERELAQSQQQAEALKLQEKRLTESQDTLQAIVDNIPRAIFWKDNDLRFMGCNKIFAKIAGASSTEELIGKTDFDMSWSAQADIYRKDDQEVMISRKAKLDIEEVNTNSAGEETWVLTSKVPIINQDGRVVAILGMFEDITARKKKEADIALKLEERKAAMNELTALKQMLEVRKV